MKVALRPEADQERGQASGRRAPCDEAEAVLLRRAEVADEPGGRPDQDAEGDVAQADGDFVRGRRLGNGGAHEMRGGLAFGERRTRR